MHMSPKLMIDHLTIDHHAAPLGFALPSLRAAWKVRGEGKKALSSRIRVWCHGSEIWDSGEDDLDCLGTVLPIALKPRTAYQWQVSVRDDRGNYAESEKAVFETGKMDEPWEARWIGAPSGITPVFRKEFELREAAEGSRLYCVGLGLYEVELNGRKLGNEYLLPGCSVYDHHVPYQTFNLDGYLKPGLNEILVRLADGWYMGRFGMDNQSGHYGDHYAFLAEMRLNRQIIGTDESWQVGASDVISKSIYDGECWKPGVIGVMQPAVVLDEEKHPLCEQMGAPLHVQMTLPVREMKLLDKGSVLLDFGQNMAGFVSFEADLPEGTEILLRYGETVQDGKLFAENLGTAKQEYRYISDGKSRHVYPRFTYYGFRYVEVSGWPDPKPEHFTACALWSDMEETGWLDLHDPLINQFINNVKWGQRSNYVDIPTDCPQRSERLGWTGDAQVFAGTAAYLTDSVAFLEKYCAEMHAEQERLHGGVPFYAPAFGTNGVCAFWGDAATLIPWTLYTRSGDLSILNRCWDSMKSWVDYIRAIDHISGDRRLWSVGFQFGDWLALDDLEDGDGFKGATDDAFIASICYMKSAEILARAAQLLSKPAEFKEYSRLSEEIRQAILDEYFTTQGILSEKTQCAHAMALEEKLWHDGQHQRLADSLMKMLKKAGMHLRTGFVGTSYLLRSLSRNGMHDAACRLFTRKDAPGWLHEVLLGATTVWERWDSILPDGRVNPAGMNSLNHYSYGCVLEWLFEDVAGLKPEVDCPGFRHVTIQPKPHWRLPHLDMAYESPMGRYEISYHLHEENRIELDIKIPFGAEATLVLPGLPSDVRELASGDYHFEYLAEKRLTRQLGVDTPLEELIEIPDYWPVLEENGIHPQQIPLAMQKNSLRELSYNPFSGISPDTVSKIESKLKQF